jgi:cytochrome c oxidase cbb3-type subunit 4
MSSVISMGVLRGLLTLILMLAFIGMVIYVYSKRNRGAYEQAALLPLEDSNSSQLSPSNGDEVKQRSQS